MRREIISFFEKNIDTLNGAGTSGGYPVLPNFELLPNDFIDFAEKDLVDFSGETYKLVNSTSNLKRAVDCQIDYLFNLLNLDKHYRAKRLGIDRKLGFLNKTGIFRSKSIEKLNKLRNRLEHHYEIPRIEDVEVYFDLVLAFVSVIESLIPAFCTNEVITMETEKGILNSVFNNKDPSILIELSCSQKEESFNFIINLNNYSGNFIDALDDFSFLMRLHLLLYKFDQGIISSDHFLAALTKDII